MERESPPTDLDERRNRISALLDEITVTTRALQANGVNPGHKLDKREALEIVKRITEKAYQTKVT